MLNYTQVKYDYDFKQLIDLINNDRELNDLFKNKINRFICADLLVLINVNNRPIGFYSLVKEKQDNNFYFLDLGIIKEYQRKGIGLEIKEQLKNKNINEFIIVETRESNDKAIGSMNKGIGLELCHENGCIYYLLQDERYKEFIEKDGMEKLANHINKNSRFGIEY